MPSSASAADLDRARWYVGGLALLHIAVAVALMPVAFSSYAEALDPTIDEYSDLSQFTPVSYWSVLGAWGPVLPTILVAFIAVRRLSSPRRHFWIAPIVGISASVILFFATYPFLLARSLSATG